MDNKKEYHENIKRGTDFFPAELHHVDKMHTRYHMPFHWHMDYELIHVISGRLNLHLNGVSCSLTSGENAWISSGTVHGGTADECVYECVVVNLNDLLPNKSWVIPTYFGKLPQESPFTDISNEIFATIKKRQTKYKWITLGLFFQMVGSILNIDRNELSNTDKIYNSKHHNSIKSVLTYIQVHYNEQITLEDLSRTAFMSPKYFCRAFFEMVGKTPIDYLIFYRIQRACEKLVTSDLSISEVALQSGFNDISYFSRMFKRHKGEAPSAWRKQHKNTVQ